MIFTEAKVRSNLYANSLLALDAATGKRIWHFQTVHHDIWDRDLPTAPALVTITKDGKKMEAVAQPTKSGFIFLFERATGKPIYPITDNKQGGIVGIFRQGSLDDERTVSIPRLDVTKTYIIKEAPGNMEIARMTGKDLVEKGFKVKMTQRYDSRVFELEMVK